MGNPVYWFFSTSRSLAPALLRCILALQLLYTTLAQTSPLIGFSPLPESPLYLPWYALSGGNTFLSLLLKFALALLLLTGFFTRACGLCLLVLMTLAIFQSTSLPSTQALLLAMTICLSLMVSGAGAFSMDRAISKILVPQF